MHNGTQALQAGVPLGSASILQQACLGTSKLQGREVMWHVQSCRHILLAPSASPAFCCRCFSNGELGLTLHGRERESSYVNVNMLLLRFEQVLSARCWDQSGCQGSHMALRQDTAHLRDLPRMACLDTALTWQPQT